MQPVLFARAFLFLLQQDVKEIALTLPGKTREYRQRATRTGGSNSPGGYSDVQESIPSSVGRGSGRTEPSIDLEPGSGVGLRDFTPFSRPGTAISP